MHRPRILLANEFGAGRGHIVTLNKLAQAFGPEFRFDAALCQRQYAAEFASLGAEIYDGPMLKYRNKSRMGPDAVVTATWGEFLGDLGFDRPKRLADVVAWWCQVLISRDVRLVLADYAPLALLAARAVGVPTIATGTGFGLPPSHLPQFPLFDPAQDKCLHDEATLLSNLNSVAQQIGLAPLAGLPEVYRATLPLVRTLPFLDMYRDTRQGPYLPPVTDISPITGQDGDEVFIYFSTQELNDPDVVEEVASLPMPRRAFLPNPPEGVAEKLAASGMVLEPAPVPVDMIARRSRLLVNAGQHGILCLGLYAGVPQVCLPQHIEQGYHARCAEQMGVARVVGRPRQKGALADAIRAAYDDSAQRRRAQDLSRQLRADLTAPPDVMTAEAVRPIKDALLFGQLRK